MPLWPLSSAGRQAVELGSDDEDEANSSGSSGDGGSGSTRSGLLRPSSHEHRFASPRFASPTPPAAESHQLRAPVAASHGNRFTTGAAPRAITAPAARPLLMGAGAASAALAQAMHHRVQSAQEQRARSDAGSAVQTPRAQSAHSNRGGSFAFTPPPRERYKTMNILVLGAPQVGKSLFINSYRAAVTNTTRWPAAPVGVSGFYGTTTVEPFPNHPREPTWLCIDTPGRLYTAEYEVLLEKLTQGMPWKTKLVGPKARSLAEIEDITCIAANQAHQCVVVVPATELIVDDGWLNTLLWRTRYHPADGVADTILYLKSLVSSLRALMNDASPFVVVTKMDRFGGAGCAPGCAAVVSLLGQCVPVNRVYFTAAVENRALLATGRAMVLESSTRQNLVRLHEDICFAVQWRNQMDAM